MSPAPARPRHAAVKVGVGLPLSLVQRRREVERADRSAGTECRRRARNGVERLNLTGNAELVVAVILENVRLVVALDAIDADLTSKISQGESATVSPIAT